MKRIFHSINDPAYLNIQTQNMRIIRILCTCVTNSSFIRYECKMFSSRNVEPFKQCFVHNTKEWKKHARWKATVSRNWRNSSEKKIESSQCFCYENDSLRCVLREFSKQNTRNQVMRLKVWEMLCRLTLLVLFCKNIDFKVKYAVSCLVHSILGVEVCSIQELVQLSIR